MQHGNTNLLVYIKQKENKVYFGVITSKPILLVTLKTIHL